MNNDYRENEKEAYVRSLFSSIAGKYDLLNSVLSLARHKAWRRRAVDMVALKSGDSALDVCCGTGDFAIELAKRVCPGGKVIGLDFAEPMIELARKKSQGKFDCIEYLVGNACALPFEDNQFNCVTVGFGLRNVADINKAIAEMARVAKPGGYVVCLEISKVRSRLLQVPWKLYFYKLTPYTARLFRARLQAYEYLPQSVREFMSREELAQRFEESGLVDVSFHDLMFGAVCIHVGKKPCVTG